MASSNDEGFLSVSPRKELPVIVDGGVGIIGVLEVLTYLNSLVPDPNIFPSRHEELGIALNIFHYANLYLARPAFRIFFNRRFSPRFLGRPGNLSLADKLEFEKIPKIMDYLIPLVEKRKSFRERDVDVGDYMLFASLSAMHMGDVSFNGSDFGVLRRYYDNLLEIEELRDIISRDLKRLGGTGR